MNIIVKKLADELEQMARNQIVYDRAALFRASDVLRSMLAAAPPQSGPDYRQIALDLCNGDESRLKELAAKNAVPEQASKSDPLSGDNQPSAPAAAPDPMTIEGLIASERKREAAASFSVGEYIPVTKGAWCDLKTLEFACSRCGKIGAKMDDGHGCFTVGSISDATTFLGALTFSGTFSSASSKPLTNAAGQVSSDNHLQAVPECASGPAPAAPSGYSNVSMGPVGATYPAADGQGREKTIMATTTDFGNSHERMQDLAREYRTLLDRMINGEILVSAPWADSHFQYMVNRELGQHGAWKLAAEKLTVIKEIFSGGK